MKKTYFWESKKELEVKSQIKKLKAELSYCRQLLKKIFLVGMITGALTITAAVIIFLYVHMGLQL